MITPELHQVLAQRPLGLVFDIDGTLSPIVPVPSEARLYPGVASLLEQARHHAHVYVAIVTGRGIEDGAERVNVDGLTYVGTHGLEWSDGLPTTHPVVLAEGAEQYVEPGKSLLDLAQQHFATQKGVIVQRKRVGGSVHYRMATNPEQTRREILALLEEPARKVHMRLGEGKLVVEVLSPLAINKGEALRRFVEFHQLRGVVFAGDDRTDLYAVQVIPSLREEGVAALSIVVRHKDTPPELLEQADIVVDEVPGMVALLEEIVKNL